MKTLIKLKIATIAMVVLFSAGAIAESSNNLTEETCLAMTIYYEARGEPIAGQYAVADVVLNRVEDERFPDSICDVILQRNQFHWKKVLPRESQQWTVAENIAEDIISNETYRGITDGALYFQAGSRIPPYADERTKKIGNHNFFL